MQYKAYKDLYITEDYSAFDFFSIGKRVIPKRIIFIPTENNGIYSLIMGDVDINNEVNDSSISANGDRNKILSTVAHVIEIYLKAFPERWVYFTGSTDGRTRLYRMAVGLNLDYLMSKFEIHAQVNHDSVPFQKNMELDGFLIKIKN